MAAAKRQRQKSRLGKKGILNELLIIVGGAMQLKLKMNFYNECRG